MKQKFNYILISLALICLAVAANAQESGNEDVLRVDTNLVRQAFITPWNDSTYEMYAGDKKIEEYRIVTPQSEPGIGLIVLLDLRLRNQPPDAFAVSKRQLKKIETLLATPTIILNLEGLSLKDARGKLGIPENWKVIESKDIYDAFSIAEDLVMKNNSSRKAFFWLSSKVGEMTEGELQKLPKNLRGKEIFTYIATIKPVPAVKGKGVQIGFSNLSLNTIFMQIGEQGFTQLHFRAFIEQCQQLNLVYYEGEADQKSEFRIFAKASAGNSFQLVQRKSLK